MPLYLSCKGYNVWRKFWHKIALTKSFGIIESHVAILMMWKYCFTLKQVVINLRNYTTWSFFFLQFVCIALTRKAFFSKWWHNASLSSQVYFLSHIHPTLG